jgi:phosphomannomutase
LEIVKLLEKPLEGFHIVVDAGNGAGGFFAVSHVVIYLASSVRIKL